MIDTGWSGEGAGLPEAARRAVVHALAQRRDRRYRDRAAQADFLRGVHAAWRRYSYGGGFDRVRALASVEAVWRAAEALAVALGNLDRETHEILGGHADLEARRRFLASDVLQRLAVDLEALGGGAATVADVLRRGRGEYERTPVLTAAFVAHVALAWRYAFDTAPSASNAGAFRAVLSPLCDVLGLDAPGDDALGAVLARL